MLTYQTGQLDHPQIKELISQHLKQMHAQTPAESVHALAIDKLKQPSITFFSAWHASRLAGIAAVQALGHGDYELKSMRTASAFLRQGVASDLLEHVLNRLMEKQAKHVFLETGSSDDFLAARQLYQKYGFSQCAPFGEYQPDPLSTFMVRNIS